MCTTIIRCLLMLINIVFMIIAAALIAGGVILAFVPSTFIEPAYQEIKKSAEKDNYNVPENAKEFKDIPLVYQIGIALLAFGIFLFGLSLLGWCGSCCTSCCKWMLVVFAAIIVLLMIAEIVVGTLFYVTNSPLHTSLRTELKNRIKNEFRSDGKDSFSMTINLVNKYFKCCGVDSIQDFTVLNPPRSCEAANVNKGCYRKLTDLIDQNIVWAGLALAGILLLQLIEVIFAIIVYKYDGKVMPI
ncbi:unnamed protein product [Candidula unifasciata]|uniref:Tetraspanin n=1 Tax=Candidula unifasciata TaxID=100452 RepID=A0A8S3YQK1_9EUPU|nr:unnamed protein product [Candidula unifasciata]